MNTIHLWQKYSLFTKELLEGENVWVHVSKSHIEVVFYNVANGSSDLRREASHHAVLLAYSWPCGWSLQAVGCKTSPPRVLRSFHSNSLASKSQPGVSQDQHMFPHWGKGTPFAP